MKSLAILVLLLFCYSSSAHWSLEPQLSLFHQDDERNAGGAGLSLNSRWELWNSEHSLGLWQIMGGFQATKSFQNKDTFIAPQVANEILFILPSQFYWAPGFGFIDLEDDGALYASVSLGWCQQCDFYGQHSPDKFFMNILDRIFVRVAFLSGDSELKLLTTGMSFAF